MPTNRMTSPEPNQQSPTPPPQPRGNRVQEAFAEAISLPTLARGAFVARLRDEDAALADEVASLLAYHAPQAHADHGALGDGNPTVSLPATLLGQSVAGCRIDGVIGYGGMSVVFAATESFPPRRVAIKVVRRERLTAPARRRLRVEAEALARLEHPNIARVYAAGSAVLGAHGDAADEASPYIVMELVEGALPLNKWADANKLSAAARIELVARIADAIEHAHRAGVIHRDIKPGNVLVGADGTPKVIDFGIAAVANSTVTAATEGPMGTLAYMSPEQARGKDVDTRSDVWGLGALLYDLVTGAPPFETADHSLAAHIDRLLNDAPEPPSAVALRARGAAFVAELPPSLDAVVAKALATDANRRYRSAAEFADELRHLVRGEPLLARPDSEWDGIARMVRRHRASLVAAAGIFTAVTGGLIASLVMLGRETAAHERAQWSAYVASISAASSMLDRGDASAAHDMLASAPAEHRGWEWRALWRLSDQALWHVSYDHGHQVYGVDFSPDGATLFAAASGWVSALDVASRTERWRVQDTRIGAPFREPSWRVRALPDGHVVVKFLDENIVRFDEHGKAVAYGSLPTTLDIAMDAARTRLFGSDIGGAIEIDPRTLTVVRRIPAVPPIAELPRALAVDGRAELFVAGDKDGVVTAFDTAGGKVRWTWRTERRGEEIRATAISPDGARAAAVSASGIVMIDRATGGELWHRIDRVHGYRSCVFTPDGRELVASAWSESVDRYDAATGAPIASLLGAFSQVWQSAVSPDGRLIASGTFGTQVDVFDAKSSSTLEEIALDGSAVTSVAVASESGRVFATTANGALFAIDGGRVATRIAIAGVLRANGVCALPTGELAVAHDAGVTWIAQGGRVLRSAPTPNPATSVGVLAKGTVTDARVSSAKPGEETLVGFDSATAAPLWSVGRFMANGGVAFETARPGVIYLPRGVGSDSRMFDMRTHDEQVPPTLAEFACCGALSPDGRIAALGCVSRAGEVTLVSGADFETVAELPNHRGAVRTVRWSPDGSRLASASLDGTVRVWHADRRIELLTAWRGLARDLAWDADATLWIACEDGKLRAMRVR